MDQTCRTHSGRPAAISRAICHAGDVCSRVATIPQSRGPVSRGNGPPRPHPSASRQRPSGHVQERVDQPDTETAEQECALTRHCVSHAGVHPPTRHCVSRCAPTNPTLCEPYRCAPTNPTLRQIRSAATDPSLAENFPEFFFTCPCPLTKAILLQCRRKT